MDEVAGFKVPDLDITALVIAAGGGHVLTVERKRDGENVPIAVVHHAQRLALDVDRPDANLSVPASRDKSLSGRIEGDSIRRSGRDEAAQRPAAEELQPAQFPVSQYRRAFAEELIDFAKCVFF